MSRNSQLEAWPLCSALPAGMARQTCRCSEPRSDTYRTTICASCHLTMDCSTLSGRDIGSYIVELKYCVGVACSRFKPPGRGGN